MKALLQKALLLSGILMLCTQLGQAATITYTAIASGNFTSASTWQGGNVPPVMLGNVSSQVDHIVIPAGITVTLDTNLISDVKLKTGIATGIIECNGTLTGQPGRWIMSRATIWGNATGVINIDSIALWSADFNYKGTINAGICYFGEYATAYSGETINISKKMIISYSNNVFIRGTVNVLNRCTIVKEAKAYFATPGSFNIVDTVNLVYNYKWGGLLPNGDRILDSVWMTKKIDTMIIDVHNKYATPGNPYACRMMKDMTFNGTLIITSGGLRLDGHKLTLGPNAKVYCSPDSGWILGDPQGSIEVKATNDIGSGLLFYPGDVVYNSLDTLKDLTMNMGNNSGKTRLRNKVIINNKLDLQKGQLHLVDNAQLIINHNTSASIIGASTNSYITNNFGTATHMNIASSATATFPVGNAQGYTPIEVKNNSSTEIFKVGCTTGVFDSATHGFDITTQEPCVAATWWVNPSAASGSNADITFQWPGSMELNSFNRAQSYVTRFDHTPMEWDTQTSSSAAGTQGSFYTHTETVPNFTTQPNYFSVFDGFTSLLYLSVEQISLAGTVSLYPNPTTGNATLALQLDKAQALSLQVVDMTGRVTFNQAAKTYNKGTQQISLPTAAWHSGVYLYQISDDKGHILSTGKLLKQ